MSKEKSKADPHDPRLSGKEARRIRRKREREPSKYSDAELATYAARLQQSFAKTLEVPAQIRTFGMVLRKREEFEVPFYSGSNGRCTINLTMMEPNKWLAVALFSSCNVNPGLTSSSFKAALRNLRGHLRNLAIDLNRMGIEPR